MMINTYILGILWSLGRYLDGTESPGYKYFFLRHKREYFLQIIKDELGIHSNIHTVTHNNKTQYRLKVSGFDIASLERLGWQSRNAEQRDYPSIVNDHRHFIRAYMEIHSSIDTITIPRKNGFRTGPRLRVYGNKNFLEQLTGVLAAAMGTGVKTVQQATRKSEISGILYYQSTTELQSIFEYVYRTPVRYFDLEYHKKFNYILTKVSRWPMTPDELEKSILKIHCIKRKIFLCMDARERERLMRKLKELQYLQLWHQDLLERMECIQA